MKEMLELILTGENLRTMLLMTVIIGDFVIQNIKTDKRFTEMDKRFAMVDNRLTEAKAEMDKRFIEVQAAFDHLKINDFGHLGNAFKNLTHVLQEHGIISEKEKTFTDTALDD